MDENIILQRISSLISKNNITPNRLLVSCNVQSNAYTKWKSGIAKPSLDALIKIANYFNVSLDYLVGRTSENDTTSNNATSNPVFDRISQLSKLQQMQVMAYIDGLQGVKSHNNSIDTRELVANAIDSGIAKKSTAPSKETKIS